LHQGRIERFEGKIMAQSADIPAICGGTPVCSKPLTSPAWPPVSQATAERLKHVYLSGEWSFNSPAELQFSQAFADSHGARHGIFMVNGTVTLQCALQACGVGPGDEVIVPALTWLATAMAAHYVGATPVFVDINPDTLCIDPVKAAEAITERTKAIFPVHLYGSMADLDALMVLADRHGLALIEDCAHMQGGKWNGRGVGSWGRVGSFSFQQSKTLASGEGGICITSDDSLAEKLYRLKHIGYPRGSAQGRAGEAPPEGLMCHNFRGTAFEATILNDQLATLAERIKTYNRSRDLIESYLTDVPGVRLQERGRLADPQGYYALAALFDGPQTADLPLELLIKAALAEGLPTRPTYGPVYRHMLYNMPRDSYKIAEGGCPVAETTGTDRALILSHQWLGSDEATLRAIGEILFKLARSAHNLRALTVQ
jgi:dTDP-4-amino-4,6-dideoxygalactose transaminase